MSLLQLVASFCHGGRLKNRQRAERPTIRSDACASIDLLTKLSPEDGDDGRVLHGPALELRHSCRRILLDSS